MKLQNLNHFLQELIDLIFSVAKVSTLDKMVCLLSPSSSWVVELEWPQKVGGILEVWSNSQDLVDQILNTNNSKFTKRLLNDFIGCNWGSVSVNLDESTLVDEVTNSLEVWTSVSDVWLDDSQHVLGSLVHLDEDSVVNLSKPHQLEALPDLG